jgi:hypothetical protein
MSNLADDYLGEGKYTQAEALSVETLNIRRRILGETHRDTLVSMHNLAAVYLKAGKHPQAEILLREALNTFQKTGSNSWIRYSCQSWLGSSLAEHQGYAEAELLLLSGYEGMLQRQASIPAAARIRLEQTQRALVRLYETLGKPEKAAEWREKIQVSASVSQK